MREVRGRLCRRRRRRPLGGRRMRRDGGGRRRDMGKRREIEFEMREGKGANSVREGDRRRWPSRRRRRSEVNQREMRDGGRVWWEGWRAEGSRERDVGWEGVSWVFIYIYLWKLPLTTLSFILNYISSPKVCIYYFYSLFLSYYFLGFKNIYSWKFIAPINSFYYTYLNPKLNEI